MGVRTIFDGMVNALTGQGTSVDRRSANAYFLNRLTQQQIEASYRSSWLMRKIVDLPALDMVREWRAWQAEQPQIAALEAEERRLDLRNKVRRAETLRSLGGGALILGIGAENPALPVNPRALTIGSLRYVHVISRHRLTLGPMITDPASEWYGSPEYFAMQGQGAAAQARIHPSRVIAFKGKAVPDFSASAFDEWFWGDSVVQTVADAVQNADAAQNGFAGLIADARNTIIGIPNLTQMVATADGERMIAGRVNALALGQSQYRATFYDSGKDGTGGETIDHRQVTWTGMPEMMAAYLSFVAGAADIPATRLLGKSPDGMNATGAADQKNYEGMIAARQELDLQPCLDQLDAVLIPSALGTRPDDVWATFNPLSTLSETEEAAVFDKTMDAVTKLQATATIPDIAMSKGVQNLMTERGWVPGLEGALAELPKDERFPDAADDTDPSALTEGGGGPDLAGGRGEEASRRRAANDGKGGGPEAGVPFEDGYDPGEERDEDGRWTRGSAILEHVTRAQASKGQGKPLSLGKATEANVALVKKHTGMDIGGHERVLAGSDVRHAFQSHGNPVREAARGQKALQKGDFARIPQIVESAHAVHLKGERGANRPQRLVYTAAIGGYHYEYVETVHPNGKIVALKTMKKW